MRLQRALWAVSFITTKAAASCLALGRPSQSEPWASQADGQKLAMAEEKQISFSPAWIDYRATDTSAKPSSFSDWGPTPDLQLKPEMAAPGGNISSAKPGGGFQLMSGTSMASPHMAGAAAVVRQYLQEKLGLTESGQVHDLTDALLMSTAHPALREDGSPYSPRQQGAGVLNLKDAVMAGSLSHGGRLRPAQGTAGGERGRQLHLYLPGS